MTPRPESSPSPSPSRRAFLHCACAAVGATVVAACGGGAGGTEPAPRAVPPPAPSPPDAARLVGTTLEITLARAPDLTRASGSYTHGPSRTFVVNLGAAGYRAYDNTCPHAGCGVSGFDGQTMICPCHLSEFNPSSGARVAGPAERGLVVRPSSLDSAAGVLRVVVG